MTSEFNSYEKVNYLLRLKKQIERKIIIETLLSLGAYVDIEKYHYVGFGSIYFADFIMFHKYLNIKNMTSVENKKEDKTRFQFNKPFDFIKLKICDSRDFLNIHAPWKDKLFIWLDYDSEIDTSMVADVEIVASRAKSGDILLVTIEGESIGVNAIGDFKQKFSQYIDSRLTFKEIKDFPKVLHSIMKAAVQNGVRSQTNIDYIQFFNITYKDTKKMYTFGVIFWEEEKTKEMRRILSKLDFVRTGSEILDIDCPIISLKEKMHIDSLIQKNKKLKSNPKKDVGLRMEIIKKYCKYYKYYPQFFESIY